MRSGLGQAGESGTSTETTPGSSPAPLTRSSISGPGSPRRHRSLERFTLTGPGSRRPSRRQDATCRRISSNTQSSIASSRPASSATWRNPAGGTKVPDSSRHRTSASRPTTAPCPGPRPAGSARPKTRSRRRAGAVRRATLRSSARRRRPSTPSRGQAPHACSGTSRRPPRSEPTEAARHHGNRLGEECSKFRGSPPAGGSCARSLRRGRGCVCGTTLPRVPSSPSS